MKKLLALSVLLATATAFSAEKRPGEIVWLDRLDISGTALPGSNVVATASFKVESGYYINANRPGLANAAPTQLFFTPPAGVRALPLALPGGTAKPIPGTTTPLMVYEDGFSVSIPLTLANPAFPLNFPAVLNFVPTKGTARQPAMRYSFTITIPRSTNAPPPAAKSATNPPAAKAPMSSTPQPKKGK
jgi:hypothetical protein